jgi:ferredoxin
MAVVTTDSSTVKWPQWEGASFYLQAPDVMYASIAAQRRAAPVFWYEPPGYPTGFWVLSKWEHQRFVGSHTELFCSRNGFAIGDASEVSTVVGQLSAWAREELGRPGVTPAETRHLIARGKLSMGDPGFESLILSDPPRHGQIRSVLMKAMRHGICVDACPQVFALDQDDDVVRVLTTEPDESLRDDLDRAVRMCPKAAIEIEDQADAH